MSDQTFMVLEIVRDGGRLVARLAFPGASSAFPAEHLAGMGVRALGEYLSEFPADLEMVQLDRSER